MNLVPVLLLYLFLSSVWGQAQTCNLKSEGEIPRETQERIKRAHLDSASDQATRLYLLARFYTAAGNGRKGLDLLTQALKDTPWFYPAQEARFQSIAGCPEFQELVRRVDKKHPPLSVSKVAHVVPAHDLIPEGLAADPANGTLYLSSTFHHKIVAITPQGKISDFVSEGQDGLLGVLGMKVVPSDRSVWAATEADGRSALFHFDHNGKTLGRYLPEEPGNHLFNDLVVTKDGDVFVTDSEFASVYKLPAGASQLVRINTENYYYPNGIALSPDEKTIYVAYAFGILLMDLNGGSRAELRVPRGASASEINGLYFYKGSLIGIQENLGPSRIVQLDLTRDGKGVTRGRLLEFRSANLQSPTTGAIYRDQFYFIVNSQGDHVRNGKLVDEEHMQPVQIAVLKLQ
jgi:hypothetical protein